MSITYPVIQLTIGGTVFEFSGTKVISANLIEEVNPISAEIPIGTIEFKILTLDESFSMFSGQYFQLLSERLPVLVYENIDGINSFIGKYYLEKWKNISEHEFEFKAVDIIGVMAATEYDGGFWSVPTTLETILVSVLNPINVLYSVDDSIKDVEISGWIPPSDYREALKQICFSAGAIATTARSQLLNILPITVPTVFYKSEITDANKGIVQPLELLPLVTNIELVSHNYTQGEVLENIFEKYLEIGSHKIIFEKPYYNIVVNGPGYAPSLFAMEDDDYFVTEDDENFEVGGEYIFGPNCLYLEMTTPGTITITGYPWLDSKRSFIFNETGVSEFANKNTLTISEATMVSADNAQIVLNNVRDYYRQRYFQNILLLPSAVKTSDIVFTSTLYQKKILATVQKMDMNLTGGYLSKVDILGIESINYRRPRVGVALCGTDLTRQNAFRRYQYIL
jgi:hypothetical protein